MSSLTKSVSLVALFVGAGLVGCGGVENDDTASLVPAGGTVNLDGVPLAYASVQFVPTTGTTGNSASGATDELGMFTLKNPRGREGAEPGNYKVVISRFARKDGTPFAPDADSGEFAAEGVEHLPPIYSDPDKATLKAEVPASGKTDFSFDLSSQ